MKIKKILAIVLCLAMVLSTMSFTAFADAKTYEVNDDAELKAALKAVDNGDTIKLAAGTYTGGFSVGKAITLEGAVDEEGNPATIFSGDNGNKSSYYRYSLGMGNGTLKNVKIINAWKGVFTEGLVKLALDNVTMEEICYGIHIGAVSDNCEGITIENCHLDITWANSFCRGTYPIVIKNNVLSAKNPNGAEYANPVNTFNPNITIVDNIFEENAKILIREEAKDAVIGTNYYADGVENALAPGSAAEVVIETYYSDVDSNGNLTGFVDTAVTYVASIKNEAGTVTYYATIQEAVKAAAEVANATNPVTIQLLAGEFEQSITLPSYIDNVTFKGADNYGTVLKNSSVGHSGGMSAAMTNITFDGIDFDNSNINLTAIYDNTKIENMTITNCKFHDITGKAAVSINTNSAPNLVGFTFTGNTIENVSGGNFSGLVLRAAPTGDIVITGNNISNVAWNAVQLIGATADSTVTITGNTLASGARGGILNLYNIAGGVILENNTFNTLEGQSEIGNFVPVAKIGNTSYTTIDAAIARAAGEEIVLLKDIKLDKPVEISGKTVTINGNGFSVKVKDIPSGRSEAAFIVKDNAVATFKDMDITGCSIVDENGTLVEGKASSAIEAINSTVNVIDSNLVGGSSWNASPTLVGSAIKAVGSTINVSNSTLASGDCKECPAPVIDIDSTSKLSLNDVVLNYKSSDYASPYFAGEVGIIDTAIGENYATAIEMSGKVEVNGRDLENVSIKVPAGETLLLEGDIDTANIYLDPDYEFDRTANGYAVVSTEELADTISVEYKDVTVKGTEGEKTYEIVVKANGDDMINELASVDLSFVYTTAPVTGGNIDFTVAPAKDFTMTRYGKTDRYMFNYNGVTAVEGTANAIPVGTITVTGYGKYTIATAAVDTNIVNATTVRDNLVDSYTVTGAEDNDVTTGGLDISAKVDGDDAVIAVPTRELTITIDFPNGIDENVVAYQDMKVEITGVIDGVNQTITYDLGEDGKYAMGANGSYVVTEDRLVLNNAYTVVVSGAGYRTARYTVTMTDKKALRFWNNVRDDAQVVEIGETDGAVKVTFLAGDIVKDNNINIYDLSAVVSYFGSVSTTENGYAKYDLNRDGVVDSKDVAYVLVSWDN